jgi:hypothetical protein
MFSHTLGESTAEHGDLEEYLELFDAQSVSFLVEESVSMALAPNPEGEPGQFAEESVEATAVAAGDDAEVSAKAVIAQSPEHQEFCAWLRERQRAQLAFLEVSRFQLLRDVHNMQKNASRAPSQ